MENYYFTKDARRMLLEAFDETDIRILTINRPECIDHISVSKKFVGNSGVEVEEWNIDKTLSDHKGIAVSFDCSF